MQKTNNKNINIKNMNEFYVYIHIKPNGEIFYVGKGKGNRAYSKNRRSKFWNDITKKYNYDVFILENNISEIEAFNLEKKYIKKIGRRDLNEGSLVNLTDGGEGTSGNISKFKGTKRSQSIKDKIAKSTSKVTKRGLNPSAKKVIDIETGFIYGCIKDVADDYNKCTTTIVKYLNSNKNKTSLRWYGL